MLNFNFLEKGLGLASAPYFEYDFSRKTFLILHSILMVHSTAFTFRNIGQYVHYNYLLTRL